MLCQAYVIDADGGTVLIAAQGIEDKVLVAAGQLQQEVLKGFPRDLRRDRHRAFERAALVFMEVAVCGVLERKGDGSQEVVGTGVFVEGGFECCVEQPLAVCGGDVYHGTAEPKYDSMEISTSARRAFVFHHGVGAASSAVCAEHHEMHFGSRERVHVPRLITTAAARSP
jgi:hypothetical protein